MLRKEAPRGMIAKRDLAIAGVALFVAILVASNRKTVQEARRAYEKFLELAPNDKYAPTVRSRLGR